MNSREERSALLAFGLNMPGTSVTPGQPLNVRAQVDEVDEAGELVVQWGRCRWQKRAVSGIFRRRRLRGIVRTRMDIDTETGMGTGIRAWPARCSGVGFRFPMGRLRGGEDDDSTCRGWLRPL